MVDAVLSYHADPISCGVTRFSQQLAKRLGVEWVCSADQFAAYRKASGLLSLKMSEVDGKAFHVPHRYDLFLHDVAVGEPVTSARRVFTANAAIADEIRPHRPDVISAWCPSMVEAHPREPITVLSFGMVHKLRTDLYETLKEKLDATGENYVVYVSAALHDGTSFGQASAAFESLRRLFGSRFVFLGTLSDEAMVDRLRTSTYVAAFFEKGLRENNTSVMAALDAGAYVLTNHDAHTPSALTGLTDDIRTTGLRHVMRREWIRKAYGWDRLVELIRGA